MTNSASESGSPPAFSPARTRYARSQAATLRAIGPTLSRLRDRALQPSRDTLLWVGLKPTIPLKAAGILKDPPVSVPIAMSAAPCATETAPPDVDPPGMHPSKIAFSGVP